MADDTQRGVGPGKPRTLVIMAAGLGSRYGGVKQIDSVGPNGEILLDYAAYDALEAGFERIVLIVRREIEADMRRRVEESFGPRCAVEYVIQSMEAIPGQVVVPPGRVKPWGTGHAILQVRPVIDGPFGVINADDFYGREAFGLLRGLLELPQGGVDVLRIGLVAYHLDRTLSPNGGVTRGVCQLDEHEALTAIHELSGIHRVGVTIGYEQDGLWRDLDGGALVSMNMWAFPPGFLDVLETGFSGFLEAAGGNLRSSEYLLPNVVGDLVASNQVVVQVSETTGCWFGLTHAEDRALVRERIRDLIAQSIYPERLWEG